MKKELHFFMCLIVAAGLCNSKPAADEVGSPDASVMEKSKVFTSARTEGLFFQNYFGHDGDDETLIGIYNGDVFARQMDVYLRNPDRWARMSDNVKSVANKVDMNSNPVLMQCTLKADFK